MPHKKKQAADAVTAPESETREVLPVEATSADGRGQVGEPASDASEPASEATATKPPARFRGWYTNTQIGYRRMTDEIAKLIVVKFNERPNDEVVARLKEAGFRYQPEYFGQEKVWTRPNNFEGRELVDRFEAILTGLTNSRTVPF
jgi:hypothetical protein